MSGRETGIRARNRIRSAAKRVHASTLHIVGGLAERGAIAKPQPANGAGRMLSPDASPIDPHAIFQPDSSFIDAYSRFDENDAANFERVNENLVMYRNIPYSKYLGVWQFHPGRIGGSLTTGPLTPKLIRTAKRVRDCMVELPNGGLALYYPPTIQVRRFVTHERLYSGIAQGQLLAGYLRLSLEDSDEKRRGRWRKVAAKIAASMQFPAERGGVCVDDRMILEAPNYRSCPESILNGWIDALLHLHDYTVHSGNSALEKFYERNVEAVAALLPTFDDPERRLSRYSNLCPYAFRLHLKDGMSRRKVRLEYLSNTPGFRDRYIADLWDTPDSAGSAYDNGVVHRTPATLDFVASVSGQYDLRIVVAGDCHAISFDPGTVRPGGSTPAQSGRRCAIAPATPFDGQTTTFFVDPRRHGLVAGHPTNFAKNGHENFYHSYHVTALYELALTVQEPRLRNSFTECADRWLAYMDDPMHKSRGSQYSFWDPAKFANTIGRFRGVMQPHSFAELRAKATAPT